MTQKLIIIRGNSGSGKSTVAKRVRAELGEKIMFLQQDVLRRDILKVKDKVGNPVIDLVEQLALYGKQRGYSILVEGIFAESKYGVVLRKLLAEFDEKYVYYFDIPFEETLRRHSLRNNNEFGETEMKEWWIEKDYLNTKGEQILKEDMSEDEIVTYIVKDIEIVSVN